MNAIRGKELKVSVVYETYAVKVNDTQVWSMCFNFTDVYHFVYLLFFNVG